ncbi:MAG TPA: DUF1003 domain-containing protein [Stellaceae bacterium]|nr:DUF1003 domain-containing protein [Stellaceae bacterium]
MKNWHAAHAEKQSAGDRIADRVASLIGSWAFIIGQTAIMVAWVLVNTLAMFGIIRFDEYPFVFLNLFMSAEAAFATPLILMSQNRSAARDREHAEHDYEVNIAAKAEIEELMTTLSRIENDKLDKIISALKVSAAN